MSAFVSVIDIYALARVTSQTKVPRYACHILNTNINLELVWDEASYFNLRPKYTYKKKKRKDRNEETFQIKFDRTVLYY